MPCYWKAMPRKSRIDAPGALHHVIARVIDRAKIFQDPVDNRNFLNRLREILISTKTSCFAWIDTQQWWLGQCEGDAACENI